MHGCSPSSGDINTWARSDSLSSPIRHAVLLTAQITYFLFPQIFVHLTSRITDVSGSLTHQP